MKAARSAPLAASEPKHNNIETESVLRMSISLSNPQRISPLVAHSTKRRTGERVRDLAPLFGPARRSFGFEPRITYPLLFELFKHIQSISSYCPTHVAQINF